ncbi:hypothetical protein [Rhizobium ruizarguesonis]|uniref:hypothetical protein n=1 Tax=Rhizobium ruizarguesonis TaxID=2081791 RepID=UPI000420575B|nr:hypothetical protein [Rhizobium ruizarguesonis]QJS31301.1 hypothetical protein RLTA1_28710 [Rhizobium leguminosarum bv. trifolii TA1]TAW02682.1 hypothetical protein ELI25_36450 [Rhizobium ruizarguesonis]TAZ44252.1 hypothetical protein ELH76_35945 [Rhizobium ruizarguesonis]TBB35874.1 hypothetical protein ELH49_36835 [Rhizobium ruizarguesonis]UFW98114.1 hypothetical protein RlegTA1_28655 [Rhizobium ruizarguesonis]
MTSITLFNVSADDKIELIEKLDNSVSFETLPAQGATFNEPVTIAIVAVSAIAVSGLVAYLLKGRQSGRVEIAHMRINTPNGSLELKDIKLEFEKEEEASAQLVNALQGWIAGALPTLK